AGRLPLLASSKNVIYHPAPPLELSKPRPTAAPKLIARQSLPAEPRSSTDPESPLHRLVFLTVLHRCPDEHDADERSREQHGYGLRCVSAPRRGSTGVANVSRLAFPGESREAGGGRRRGPPGPSASARRGRAASAAPGTTVPI